jgi:protein MpaA
MTLTAARFASLLAAVACLAACVSTPRRNAVDSDAAAPANPPVASASNWKAIGFSVQRRPLLALQKGTGPLRIYLIGGIHGDETEGRSALDYIEAPNSAATLRMLRDLNPDGTAANTRVNAHGFDLNRDWPALNFGPGAAGGEIPLSEPETSTLAHDIRAFRPDVVVVLHASASGPFVNYDGPAAALATAFADAARTVDYAWQVKPDIGYPTPGSLGSYLGMDQGIPILTIEFQRGQPEDSARAALQKGLSAVISSARRR